MAKPILLVIAGCNGAGKSSFSDVLTSPDIIPFDLRDRMTHNMTSELFTKSIDIAIDNNQNFCYETNFNASPMYWPNHFKEAGYQIDMIYFCLGSIEEAIKRVHIRVEDGGHSPNEIKSRFYQGYHNLEEHYKEFDNIRLLNSSFYNEKPRHILSSSCGYLIEKSDVPTFLKDLIPGIYNLTIAT